MGRKKKVQISEEERIKVNLEYELNNLRRCNYLIPTPTYVLNVGDEIKLGNLQDVIIEEVIDDGKIYKIDYTYTDNNYGNPIKHEHCKMYRNWMDIRKESNKETTLIKNNDMRLNYSQRELSDLLSRAYHFGIDFAPEYQRDYVWELKDKVALIDSIFNCIDIGKFVFIKNGYSDDYLYEVLDGKQRIRTILDFYEDRFQYEGYYFSDLSSKEQDHFERYSTNIAEVEGLTHEQILRYFLMLNTGGKQMDKEHLDKIREQLIKKEKVK